NEKFESNFFFSSRRRHTRSKRDWSSDVCSSDLKYDIDMLRELSGEATDIQVVAVTDQQDAEVEKLADKTIVVNEADSPFTNDFHLAFQYIMFAQVLAVKKSLDLGITPDNPSPSGAINRVVQGVTIHSFNQ